MPRENINVHTNWLFCRKKRLDVGTMMVGLVGFAKTGGFVMYQLLKNGRPGQRRV